MRRISFEKCIKRSVWENQRNWEKVKLRSCSIDFQLAYDRINGCVWRWHRGYFIGGRSSFGTMMSSSRLLRFHWITEKNSKTELFFDVGLRKKETLSLRKTIHFRAWRPIMNYCEWSFRRTDSTVWAIHLIIFEFWYQMETWCWQHHSRFSFSASY